MNEDDIRYRAVQSRDPRFDGRFFTGVMTTGVYCRPVCPARTPLRKHVRFFSCAAAAEAAGFRPCLRCRPETAPGSSAWRGTATTVTSALRLIQTGFLDSHSLEQLSSRLGMGPRHLNRLFLAHVGVPPGNIARTRRLHFARTLVKSSSLSMTQIALNSGFSSIRQFNESFRSAYSISPSELRKSARGGDQGHGETGITIRLTYRPPFAWDRLVAFLLPRQIPEIEHVGPDRYARTVRYPDGTAGTLEVSPLAGEHALLARFTPIPIHGLAGMVQRVRSMFDLDADPAAIDAVLSEDPALSPLMAERPGLRIPGIWDVFEFVVRAILGQQVSVKSATTMAARLVRLTATPAGEVSARVTPGGFLFPDPETLAAADLSQLAVTESRRKTLAVFSQNVATGALSLDSPELPQRLIELPGIGPWTVAYTAMRALGEPDILPASDLVLRKAVGAALPGRTGRPLMSVRDVEQRGNSWRPWRSYATMYLWDRWL